MVCGVAAVHGDAAVEGAAGEVRDESVDGAEERGLADSRVADDEAEFAFLDGQVDLAQGWFGRVLVLDGDLVEGDHEARPLCAGLGGGARNPAVPARRIAAVGTRGRVGQLSG